MDCVDRRFVLYSIDEHKKVADNCSAETKAISDLLHNQIADIIKTIPRENVKRAFFGKWIEHRFTKNVRGYECSFCHTTWDFKTNYCPHCGADMREVIE